MDPQITSGKIRKSENKLKNCRQRVRTNKYSKKQQQKSLLGVTRKLKQIAKVSLRVSRKDSLTKLEASISEEKPQREKRSESSFQSFGKFGRQLGKV